MSGVGRWRALAARVVMDTTPLRLHRDYRRLFVAGAVSSFGAYVTLVAAPLQLARLTDSFLVVGALGLVELVPLVVFGLIGGAIADSADRAVVARRCQAVLVLTSGGLLVNAVLGHPRVWLVFVLAAVAAAAEAVQRPSVEAMIPRLVPRDTLPAANALAGLQGSAGQVVAPALGGLLAAASLPLAYAVDTATAAVALGLLVQLPSVRPLGGGTRPSLRGIGVGMRYALSRQELLGTYVVDIVAMTLAFPSAVFPFLARDLGPSALGLLYSAGGVGAVLVTLTSGWMGRVHRHGLAVAVAALSWGAAVGLAGLAPGLWPVLALLVVAGAADMVSGIFRDIVWSQTIPDELRGRLAGIELLSFTTGPSLGNGRAGLMASWGGARFSMSLGGLLCVGGVTVATALLPRFRRYDNRTAPPVRAHGGH